MMTDSNSGKYSMVFGLVATRVFSIEELYKIIYFFIKKIEQTLVLF